MSGTYHDYFKENVITVMAPVTQGFFTKGYLLIHSPLSNIEQRCHSVMNPVYISLGVIYLLSFIFLLGMHFIVYRPVKKISEAAKQYALGNLDYEIPVSAHDEVGYLSASLNYMLHSSRTWMITRKKSWQMCPTTSVRRSHLSKDMWRQWQTAPSHRNCMKNI